jgi:hypothetical protein
VAVVLPSEKTIITSRHCRLKEAGCTSAHVFNLLQPDPDFCLIVITIVIEKPIRINHNPIFIFKSNPGFQQHFYLPSLEYSEHTV